MKTLKSSKVIKKIQSKVTKAYNKFRENLPLILIVMNPYLYLWISKRIYRIRNGFYIGGEVIIPILILLGAYIINEYNQEYEVPLIPLYHKRFTEIKKDGTIVANKDDVEEMIVYIAAIEQSLEKEGMSWPNENKIEGEERK